MKPGLGIRWDQRKAIDRCCLYHGCCGQQTCNWQEDGSFLSDVVAHFVRLCVFLMLDFYFLI